jgi:hypothetical protein
MATAALPEKIYQRYLTDSQFYHQANTIAEVFCREHGLSRRDAQHTAILALVESER